MVLSLLFPRGNQVDLSVLSAACSSYHSVMIKTHVFYVASW